MNFKEFCYKMCDGLYDPKFNYDEQCTGYKQLLKMLQNDIEPASLEDMERWEKKPTFIETISVPDIKYLRFLHPLLRPYIIENWNNIKKLEYDDKTFSLH